MSEPETLGRTRYGELFAAIGAAMVTAPITADDQGELARMLQSDTPACKLTDMETRAMLELMQQRGWKITRTKND